MGCLHTTPSTGVDLISVQHIFQDSDRSNSQRSLQRTASCRNALKDFDKCPFPTDLTVVTVGGEDVLVIADYTNRIMKTFSVQGIREVSLPDLPYRLTRMPLGTVAVTLPLSREIHVIDVTDMNVVTVVKTTRMYVSITSLPGKRDLLAVGTLRDEPASIDIIDLTGHVFRSFTHDQYGNVLCVSPSFLSTTPSGDILISDYSMHALLCLSQSGALKWRHQPHRGLNFLDDPVGVACFDSQNIFLVDRLQRCVRRFTAECWCYGLELSVQNTMAEPFSVCTDSNGTVYISLDNGDIEVYPSENSSTVKTFITVPHRLRVNR